jgi:hypothetical protein
MGTGDAGPAVASASTRYLLDTNHAGAILRSNTPPSWPGSRQRLVPKWHCASLRSGNFTSWSIIVPG